MNYEHEPEKFYWAAGSDECPHGTEPDWRTDGEAHDTWMNRHISSDDFLICLDAPMGMGCSACSAENGEMVDWAFCRVCDHARPKSGIVPSPGEEHQQVSVWVGPLDCFDRECDEYFDEEGNERPGIEFCSHIKGDVSCSCRRQEDGEYAAGPCITTLEESR